MRRRAGIFSVVIGGDQSIGYPDVRAIAPQIDGKVGIMHLDQRSLRHAAWTRAPFG
ncbi:MAG: arginase family protein [Solirubrobacteraceae bacterium]